MIFTGWEGPLALLEHEVTQREYEGCPVPEALREKIDALNHHENTWDFETVDTALSATGAVAERSKIPLCSAK